VGSKETDNRVDRSIDRAVREMLDLEPRADLRARIIDRIERPRRRFRWTWMIVPAAAAALLVIAIAAGLRKTTVVPLPSHPMDSGVAVPAPQAPSPLVRREEPPNRMPLATDRHSDRRIEAAIATDVTTFPDTRPEGFAQVDALAPPPPIALEQIPSASPAPIARLDIAPLHLPALEVNALSDSPPERREE
jgi:hypothetical protein